MFNECHGGHRKGKACLCHETSAVQTQRPHHGTQVFTRARLSHSPLGTRSAFFKLGAQITFTPKGEFHLTTGLQEPAGEVCLEYPLRERWRLMVVQEQPNQLSQDFLDQVNPEIRAEGTTPTPGMARNIPPIVVQRKPMACPVSVPQYPISRAAAEGIWVHLKCPIDFGILIPCQSQWNTPLLLQDLRLVNEAVEPLHPNVPNPYTILSPIPPEAKYFTVLDLKDAYFCCRLAPQSQHIFAFQWEDSQTGTKQQFKWMCV